MNIPTLEGIQAKTITTNRITTRVLFSRQGKGAPVLFLHGNWSCATWWEQTILALPSGFWSIAPDQRGYGEADLQKKIDATRGVRDWVDDAIALLDYLGIDQAHIVGCSLGGFIVWQLMVDHPQRISSITLVSPGSPFGFSGTKDEIGTPCYADHAGTGGGTSNMELIKRAGAKDRSLDSPSSPRASMRTLFSPGFIPPREEELLDSVLNVHLGDKDIPGDFVSSPNWPFIAPGVWGAQNATSPKYLGDVNQIYDGRIKIPLIWIRGERDQVISNQSLSDVGYLGKLGYIPGWPGDEVYPPQPMIDQIRAVLEKYQAAGGSYQEVVIQDAAHIPFLEKPNDFNAAFHQYLKSIV
ncbi:MAG: alpha/beta hydrolase [Anaerolineales bacterium]|nr:MAG: alpha/beta hydrolase [Anaerolineales bacterium]